MCSTKDGSWSRMTSRGGEDKGRELRRKWSQFQLVQLLVSLSQIDWVLRWMTLRWSDQSLLGIHGSEDDDKVFSLFLESFLLLYRFMTAFHVFPDPPFLAFDLTHTGIDLHNDFPPQRSKNQIHLVGHQATAGKAKPWRSLGWIPQYGFFSGGAWSRDSYRLRAHLQSSYRSGVS